MPPDLLTSALEKIVYHEGISGSLTVPILRSKYGDVLLRLAHQKYISGSEFWLRWGGLLGLLILRASNKTQDVEHDCRGRACPCPRVSKKRRAEGLSLPLQFLPVLLETLSQLNLGRGMMITGNIRANIKARLISSDKSQNIAGLLALAMLAESLKISGARPIFTPEAKGMFNELAELAIPYLNPGSLAIQFSACWAIASLARIRVWHPRLGDGVVVRLLDLFCQSRIPEMEQMTERAIKAVPVDPADLSDVDVDLLALIKGRVKS
jgi:hypothetical protein